MGKQAHLTKENLKHLIMGKIMGDSFDIEKAIEAKRIVLEIMQFMEEQNMFNPGLK